MIEELAEPYSIRFRVRKPRRLYTEHLRYPHLFCDLRPYDKREQLLDQNDVVIQMNLLADEQLEEALIPAYCVYPLQSHGEVHLAIRLLAMRKAWEQMIDLVTVEPGEKPPKNLPSVKPHLLSLQKRLTALDQFFGDNFVSSLLDGTVILVGNEKQATQVLFRKSLWQSGRPLPLQEWEDELRAR
jgi:hypothetical protein